MSAKELRYDIEQHWRNLIRHEALSWIGTPYHLGARLKGAGCDCYTLICEVMILSGVLSAEELPIYSGDWFAHISEEKYLFRLMRFATKVFEGVGYASSRIQTGNVLAVRAAGTQSRVFNHGAIVTNWPRAIHAIAPKVEEFDVTSHHMWAFQPIRVFDPFGRLNAQR